MRTYVDHWQMSGPLLHFFSAGMRGYYPSVAHEESLSRIDFLVESRRRCGILIGEKGTGKSVVLRAAARRLRRNDRIVALVDAFGLSTREFLWQLADELGTTPLHSDDVSRLWFRISDRITENRFQQSSTVLLVDDAGLAGPDLRTQLVRLSRLDPTFDSRWTMIVAARPGETVNWTDTWVDGFDLRIDLRAWSETETMGFVQTALVNAGRLEPVFDRAALVSLHQFAEGVPRQVIRLTELSLMEGAACGLELIGVETVEAVAAKQANCAVA